MAGKLDPLICGMRKSGQLRKRAKEHRRARPSAEPIANR